MPEGGPVQRIAGDLVMVMSVVYMGLVLWQWLDPEFEPADLLVKARGWLSERVQRAEAFRRTLDSIRDLPEPEKP